MHNLKQQNNPRLVVDGVAAILQSLISICRVLSCNPSKKSNTKLKSRAKWIQTRILRTETWFDIYSIKTSTSFYRKPRNRNENAVSRKFKFKYLNCRDLFQHNLSLGPGPPLRRLPRCRRHRLWKFRPPQPGRSLYQLPGSPGQEKIEEFNIVIHLSLGPLLNSLHEDFLTEPISVLCNLNDINRDAKTNKHPFQFFNEKK